MRPLSVVLTAALMAGAALSTQVTAQPAPTVAVLLEKAGAYLADYEKQFAGVSSEERYTQLMRTRSGNMTETKSRTLRSDVIVINTGGASWAVFRDVVEVDGKPVRDRDSRLQKLFVEAPSQAMAQAQTIANEGARYNLGSVVRNINVPTMALTYLRGANQGRSTFKVTGREKVDNVQTVVLSFEEFVSPTVIWASNHGLLATGRFWLDPSTGRVVKSELSVNGDVSAAKITATYAPTQTLTIWVPVAMDEDYTTTSGTEHVTAQAKYTDFHQFKVSTGVIK